MNPTVQIRMQSMRRALADIILPALADHPFAAEQAVLVMQHLIVLEDQIGGLVEHEGGLLDEARTLARALDALAEGGPCTAARAALAQATTIKAGSFPDIAAALETMNQAIDGLLQTMWEDGDPAHHKALTLLVAASGQRTAATERSFFAKAGF